jgi:predicted enzyme related to lactoylglutathione lyase
MKNLILPILAAGLAFAQTPPMNFRVSMLSLPVKEMKRSVKFYGETLGLQLSGPPGEVTLYRAGDILIALNQPAGDGGGSALAGRVEVIFPVESVAATHAELVKRGCKFLGAPKEVTSGTWAATFTDPDAHRLTILGPR